MSGRELPPAPTHRVVIKDNRSLSTEAEMAAQAAAQIKQIVEAAQKLPGDTDLIGIQVWYEDVNDAGRSTTALNYDSAIVDTKRGAIVGTYPPNTVPPNTVPPNTAAGGSRE